MAVAGGEERGEASSPPPSSDDLRLRRCFQNASTSSLVSDRFRRALTEYYITHQKTHNS